MNKAKNTVRRRKNLRIPDELAEWAEKFAVTKHTNFTQLVVDHLVKLREENPHVQ